MSSTVTAPAKLTLSLRVTGTRPDGYHLIDAEMVTLDLADELTISPAPTTSIDLTGPYAGGIPDTDDNLVTRALQWCGRHADVLIDKRIPHGGGLGGGSADAASVLRWAGRPSDPAGLAAAARLGADVPFCLIGGRARVRGIGELVEPLPPVARTFTLVIPPLSLATPDVYRAWDDLGGPTAPGPNDLEPAAIVVAPEMARWRDRIRELSGRVPVLAGSGATWFVHGRRDDALAALGDEGAEVVVATTE